MTWCHYCGRNVWQCQRLLEQRFNLEGIECGDPSPTHQKFLDTMVKLLDLDPNHAPNPTTLGRLMGWKQSGNLPGWASRARRRLLVAFGFKMGDNGRWQEKAPGGRGIALVP